MSGAERIGCDFLVIGAGMAGLTAAARAAEAGARVIVVEKAAEIGGSAALSGGFVWTTTSRAHMAYHDDGDPRLHDVVVDLYPAVLAWLRQRGIEMGPPQRVLFGRGYQIDILGYLQHCSALVEGAGGHIVRNTDTVELLRRGGRVAGALTRHPDGEVEVEAGQVLLATGGFQGSEQLRAELIHPAARQMPLRSNPTSRGDGLRLGIAAGGAYAGPNAGFYGHLLAWPVPLERSADFVTFTQYHSDHGVLLNRQGRRFVDESRADHESTQHTLRQDGARALLVWDARVQEEIATAPPVAGTAPLDRFELAIAAGAKGAQLTELGELPAFAGTLGYDGAACLATLEAYNQAMRQAPEAIVPARVDHARALERSPYHVLEVCPAITFTFGGLFVDAAARALDPFGAPLEGLLVAGADAGNIYRNGYAGGLALAATFGYRAAETAGYSR
ncbi:MAG TPA: FAD-dependent oxidoreductase [Paracoccaceae bacterium]|nr:FAD-dependent oxidoreductase [Paracoccaceae bacterium]